MDRYSVRKAIWPVSVLVVLWVVIFIFTSCGKKGPPLAPLDEPAVSGPVVSGPAAPEPAKAAAPGSP